MAIVPAVDEMMAQLGVLAVAVDTVFPFHILPRSDGRLAWVFAEPGDAEDPVRLKTRILFERDHDPLVQFRATHRFIDTIMQSGPRPQIVAVSPPESEATVRDRFAALLAPPATSPLRLWKGSDLSGRRRA